MSEIEKLHLIGFYHLFLFESEYQEIKCIMSEEIYKEVYIQLKGIIVYMIEETEKLINEEKCLN